MLTMWDLDKRDGVSTFVLQRLVCMHVLNIQLVIGEKLLVKILTTGNPTEMHPASILAACNPSKVYK